MNKITALVISGGGSKGVFAIGVESILKKEYDNYFGSSTGGLSVLMIACGYHDRAKKLYTSFTNNSFYDKSPFNKKNKLIITRLLYNLVRKKSSISRSTKLLSVIRENYTEADHKRLRKENKTVEIVVSNMTLQQPKYINNNKYNWEDFTYWVWVSTLAYPFTQTTKYRGYEYADGGYTVSLAVNRACTKSHKVKAIVLSLKNETKEFNNDTIPDGIKSIIDFNFAVNLKKDIQDGVRKDNEVNFIFMPELVTKQPMIFIPKQSLRMYELGRKVGKELSK